MSLLSSGFPSVCWKNCKYLQFVQLGDKTKAIRRQGAAVQIEQFQMRQPGNRAGHRRRNPGIPQIQVPQLFQPIEFIPLLSAMDVPIIVSDRRLRELRDLFEFAALTCCSSRYSTAFHVLSSCSTGCKSRMWGLRDANDTDTTSDGRYERTSTLPSYCAPDVRTARPFRCRSMRGCTNAQIAMAAAATSAQSHDALFGPDVAQKRPCMQPPQIALGDRPIVAVTPISCDSAENRGAATGCKRDKSQNACRPGSSAVVGCLFRLPHRRPFDTPAAGFIKHPARGFQPLRLARAAPPARSPVIGSQRRVTSPGRADQAPVDTETLKSRYAL